MSRRGAYGPGVVRRAGRRRGAAYFLRRRPARLEELFGHREAAARLMNKPVIADLNGPLVLRPDFAVRLER